jgi:hypothetical protein
VYVSLGATEKRCLSEKQLREAVRLCNCKKYGWPEGPVKGIGFFGQTNISVDLEKFKGDEDPCSKGVRVDMPKDFNPKDPCEAASRLTCKQKQAIEIREAAERQKKKREQRAKEEEASFEEEVVLREARRQKLIVGGILAAVLVGAGLVVYRSTKG